MKHYQIKELDENIKIQKWLKKKFPLVPFSNWQKWMRTGQIRLNGRRIKGHELLSLNDSLRLPPFIDNSVEDSKGNLSYIPSAAEVKQFQDLIIFEDNHIIVLNKPSGLAVQGGTKLKRHVDGFLKVLYPQQSPKLVHRIDKETSGLLIVAKTNKTAQFLTQAFAEHHIKKTYLALVDGMLPHTRGNIKNSIEKQAHGGMERMCVSTSDTALYAETNYDVLSVSKALQTSLVRLSPLTGRTHQLRVQCAHLGCPIMGDKKYHPQPAAHHKLMLHAYQIEFLYEDKKYTFSAPLPAYFQDNLIKQGLELPQKAAL